MLENSKPKKKKQKYAFYAVLAGRAVRGKLPPLIAQNYEDAASSHSGYPLVTKAYDLKSALNPQYGSHQKGFKKLEAAVNWVVDGYTTQVKEALLKHIHSLQ